MNTTLSKEMQQHTYAIMNRVEDSHWWYVGRRAILESLPDANFARPFAPSNSERT